MDQSGVRIGPGGSSLVSTDRQATTGVSQEKGPWSIKSVGFDGTYINIILITFVSELLSKHGTHWR